MIFIKIKIQTNDLWFNIVKRLNQIPGICSYKLSPPYIWFTFSLNNWSLYSYLSPCLGKYSHSHLNLYLSDWPLWFSSKLLTDFSHSHLSSVWVADHTYLRPCLSDTHLSPWPWWRSWCHWSALVWGSSPVPGTGPTSPGEPGGSAPSPWCPLLLSSGSVLGSGSVKQI